MQIRNIFVQKRQESGSLHKNMTDLSRKNYVKNTDERRMKWGNIRKLHEHRHTFQVRITNKLRKNHVKNEWIAFVSLTYRAWMTIELRTSTCFPSMAPIVFWKFHRWYQSVASCHQPCSVFGEVIWSSRYSSTMASQTSLTTRGW